MILPSRSIVNLSPFRTKMAVVPDDVITIKTPARTHAPESNTPSKQNMMTS
jgi:hypothetical protein